MTGRQDNGAGKTGRTPLLDDRGTAAASVEKTRGALEQAIRRGAPEAQRRELEQAHKKALAALAEARTRDGAARASAAERKSALQPPFERIATLDAKVPVAFFPVRLETRFRRNAPGGAGPAGELLVRIYPDGLLAQTHEPLLTETEVAAGQAFWRRVFQGLPERDAWAALLMEANATRAAWLVDATRPDNADIPRPAGGSAPPIEPNFGPVGTRPPGWHRAPEAPTLPDCWIVSAYRGTTSIHQVISRPVREGLALTLRLGADAEDPALDDAVDLSGDGLEIEPELRWAYDFVEAEAAGMAVRIDVSAQDLADGFTSVLVAGLRTTETPDLQADALQALLDGHRLSRGLAFVPQGAKTNNSRDAPSDYPPADPAGDLSFAVARGAPLGGPGTDGHRFMTALGVDAKAADHVAGADRDEQRAAGAMADGLWPSTIGYYLAQMLAPEVSDATIQDVRRYFRDRVRARGPFPAFRVGSVPYGLLPVGALSRWEAHPDDPHAPVAGLLTTWAKRLTGLWSDRAARSPRVGRSGDPDADLVEALGQDASSQTARIRQALGEETTWNVLGFLGVDFKTWRDTQQRLAKDLLQAVKVEDRDPRVVHLSLADRAPDFAGPLVQRQPLSESDPLVFDYIAWLRGAAPDLLRDQHAPPTAEPLDALLYLMLRHALLAEYDAAALQLLSWRELAQPREGLEQELVGIHPLAPSAVALRATVAPADATSEDGVPVRRTAWERLGAPLAEVSGGAPLGTFIADPTAPDRATHPFAREVLGKFAAYRDGLAVLERLPSKELERLFTETLDVCSHRIDAWVTSLFTGRLERLRNTTPRGAWIGCYGWVVDLVADPAPTQVKVRIGRDGEALARTDSGGWIYAPSMMHGATAAVLRSAYLTRSGSGVQGDTYAVDLSSRRTRLALDLVDSVGDEQPIGAALGYQFERGLHEGHPTLELDKFIDVFRALYPLVANKAQDSMEPAESVAARNVVDGLRLRQAWLAGTLPWGAGGLTPTVDERKGLEAELLRLDEAVDAVSDLLLAESVHQVLKGSTAGTSATLDSLSRGQPAPAPEVVSTPRGGDVLHQRVGLVLSDAPLAAAWAALGLTPRAAAAPELNAWLAGLLGAPDELACAVRVGGALPVKITAARLGLQPIDLLSHATSVTAGSAGQDLDRRVAWAALDGAALDAPAIIDYQDAAGAAWSLAEAMELLAECGRAIGMARPLQPRDLVPPELESRLAEADLLLPELEGRAAGAAAALQASASAIDTAMAAIAAAPAGTDPTLAGLRTALRSAAILGTPAAHPGTRFDDSSTARAGMLEQARGVRAALSERLAAVAVAATPTEVLKAALGRSFPVLPRFKPAVVDLLAPALATEPELGPGADEAVEAWLEGLFAVREPLDPWRQVLLYGRALGRNLPRPRIVQLPLEASPAVPRWAALPYGGGPPPRSGLVSLALLGAPPLASAAWCGLLLDGWPEILPNSEEDAGVVFHHDAPGAQAPQCVLLAVPPASGQFWSWGDLEATLLETLQLAQVRSIDLETLGRLGQALPMTFLAANPANATVATRFLEVLRNQAIVVKRVE